MKAPSQSGRGWVRRKELRQLRREELFRQLDRARRESPRLELRGEGARDAVARLVVGPGGDGRQVREIPGEREQRHREAAVGRARREGREEDVAHLDAAPRGTLHAQGRQPAAALMQVVGRPQHLQRRRRQIDGHRRAHDRPVVHADRPPEAVARSDLERGRPFLQPQLLGGHRDLQALLVRDGFGERLLSHDGSRRALNDHDLDRSHAAARGPEAQGERGLEADELRSGRELGANAGHALAPGEV